MVYGIIYSGKNLVSGKMYIGQTTRDFDQRVKEHVEYNCFDSIISNAIKKYGADKFEWNIISICSSQDELNEQERIYIEQYNSLHPNGYNLTTGGHQGGKFSEEVRSKMSELMKGEKNPNYGKKHSEEARRKMSEKAKLRVGSKNSFYGKKHRKDSIEKISEFAKTRIGENNPFYGKEHSEESRKKISEGKKGKGYSEETKKRMSKSKIGLLVGEKNGMFGKPSWNKGMKMSEEHCLKIKEGKKAVKDSRESKF